MKSALAFLLYLAAVPTAAQAQVQSQKGWDQLRDEAESRFEMVKILIKQHKFEKLLAETEKLFSAPFPEKEEHLLAESAEWICHQLAELDQIPLAHQVIDQALKTKRHNATKAAFYQEKAHLFRKQGKDEEAMKYYERSLQLQNSGP